MSHDIQHRTSEILRSTWYRKSISTLCWRLSEEDVGGLKGWLVWFGFLCFFLHKFPSTTIALSVGKGNTQEEMPFAQLSVCSERRWGKKNPKQSTVTGLVFLLLFMNYVNLNHTGQNDQRVVWKRFFFLDSRYTGIAICIDVATGLKKEKKKTQLS